MVKHLMLNTYYELFIKTVQVIGIQLQLIHLNVYVTLSVGGSTPTPTGSPIVF